MKGGMIMSRSFNKKQFHAIIDVVYLFLRWAVVSLIILTSLLFVSNVVMLFLPQSILDYDLANLENVNIQLMNVMYSLNNASFTGIVNVKWLLSFALFTGIVNLVFIIIVMILLRNLIADVKQQQPFSENNIKRLKYMGYAYLISSIVLPFINQSFSMYVVNLFELWQATVNFSINLQAVFMGVIILILAGVFEYGEYLQEDHDLTV